MNVKTLLFQLFFTILSTNSFAQTQFESPFFLDKTCTSEDRRNLNPKFFKENSRIFKSYFSGMLKEFNLGGSIRAHHQVYLYFLKNPIPIDCANELGESTGLALIQERKIRLSRSSDSGFTQETLFHEMYHLLSGSHREAHIDFAVFCTASQFGHDGYFDNYNPSPTDQAADKKYFRKLCATGGDYELLNDKKYSGFVQKIGGKMLENYSAELMAYENSIPFDGQRLDKIETANRIIDRNNLIKLLSNEAGRLDFLDWIKENIANENDDSKNAFVKNKIIRNLDLIFEDFKNKTAWKELGVFEYLFLPLARAKVNPNYLGEIIIKYLSFSIEPRVDGSKFLKVSDNHITYGKENYLFSDLESYQVVVPQSILNLQSDVFDRDLGVIDQLHQFVLVPKDTKKIRLDVFYLGKTARDHREKIASFFIKF